jgi:hypothetical protein
MMLPPVVVSLPFKLIFFVPVDGWSLAAYHAARATRCAASGARRHTFASRDALRPSCA